MLRPGLFSRLGPTDVLGAGLVVLLSIVTSLNAIDFDRGRGVLPSFYQSYFEPAVRVACGQPFGIDQTKKLTGEMQAFLKTERETLSCDHVPPPETLNANPPTRIWYHMLVATGGLWKVTGISWRVMDAVGVTLLALAALALYGMFRLWTPAPVAAVLALVASLPGQPFLLFLRDLNKAPFILASFFVVALLVSRRLEPKRLIVVMAGVGALLGVGYGFRPDVLIGLPLLALAAIFFRPDRGGRALRDSLVATGVMFGAFFLAASPIFSAFTKEVGSCHWHFSLLGLSDVHTGILGLQPRGISWLSHYDDLVLWRSVESYAERVNQIPAVGYCTPGYDQVSRTMYLQAIATFPYDFLSRALAAAQQVIGYGFWGLPRSAVSDHVIALLIKHRSTLQTISVIGWAIMAVVLLVRNFRLGLFACIALAYVCAYPVVQFDTRHYFHLAFLAWIPVGLAVAVGVRMFYRRRASSAGDGEGVQSSAAAPPGIGWLRALGVLCGFAVLAGGVMYAARSYQEIASERLLSQYLRAESAAATKIQEREDNGTYHVVFAGIPPRDDRRVTGQMLRVEVGGDQCAPGSHTLTLAFGGPDPGYEFKKDYAVTVSRDRPSSIVFVPIYFERGRIDRVSLTLPKGDRGCLTSARWVDPRQLPELWVGATLPMSSPPSGAKLDDRSGTLPRTDS